MTKLSIIILIAQLAGRMGIGNGPTLPISCSPGDVFVVTGSPTLNVCTSTNTWSALGWMNAIPSGLLTISLTVCPTGWTENSAFNGRFLRGTIAANGNVGTTGGSDSITPTFTGTPLATHFHELPLQITSNSIREINSTVFGSGTTRTAINATTMSANTTSAAVALSEAKSAGTPSGVISQIDNRPAYTNVIFCSKN